MFILSFGIGGGVFGNFVIFMFIIVEKCFLFLGGSCFVYLILKDLIESVVFKVSDVVSWCFCQWIDIDLFMNWDDGVFGSVVLGGVQDNSLFLVLVQLLCSNSVFDIFVKGSVGDFGMVNLCFGDCGDGYGLNSFLDMNFFCSFIVVDGCEEQ